MIDSNWLLYCVLTREKEEISFEVSCAGGFGLLEWFRRIGTYARQRCHASKQQMTLSLRLTHVRYILYTYKYKQQNKMIDIITQRIL